MSIIDLYRGLAVDLPAALVQASAIADIERIIADVPSHADTLGFEIRLAGEDRRVDLGMAFSLASGGDVFLANPGDQTPLARAIDLDDRWRRLHAFGRGWVEKRSWRIRVPFLFLEFDGDAPHIPIPVPSVFIGLDWPIEELGHEARRAGREADTSQTPGFADVLEMITTLRRERLSAATQTLVARCLASMPPGGVVLHVGVMLGRPGEGVRLSLLLPRADAFRYFQDLGWRSLAELERTLELEARAVGFSHHFAPVQIDVDVGADLGLGFGVMLQPRSETSWPLLLEVLVAAGLCDLERARGLLSWPGARQLRGGTRVERYLAHAKIAGGAGAALRAKAYIGARPQG